MSNFFATPTDVWGDNAVMLTTVGIIIIAAVMVVCIAAAVYSRQKDTAVSSAPVSRVSITTRQLVFSAAAMALGIVTSMIKMFELPTGGAVTLCSMLFIVLIGYWYGPKVGICTAFAYGLLQFILEPIFYTIPQMLIDYPLAFGALGLSGFFSQSKHGLIKGYIVAVLGRYFFAFLSGVVFFGSYAPEGMNTALYSFIYNGSYICTEAVITLILISLPPVSKALQQMKRLACGM